jgi:hypothetical protein
MRYMDAIDNQESLKNLYKKMAPPLVTLLSAEPEIQYVALRNINLIVQRRPLILANEIKVFFCKYNDPIYVKMEKLEIMVTVHARTRAHTAPPRATDRSRRTRTLTRCLVSHCVASHRRLASAAATVCR